MAATGWASASAGDEEPERGDLLRDGLAAAGVDDRRGARSRRWTRSLAVHDADVRRLHAPRRTRRGSPRGTSIDPGQPHVVPYLFALHRLRRPPPTRPASGDDPRRDRAVRHGHDDADQRGHVRCRLLGGPLPRFTPPIWCRPARPPRTPPSVRRGITPVRRTSAARATSTTRPPRRSGCVTAGFERVAIVDIDAHQGNGTQEIFWDRGDVLYASVHVDPGRRLVPAHRRLRRRERRRRRRGVDPQRAGACRYR